MTTHAIRTSRLLNVTLFFYRWVIGAHGTWGSVMMGAFPLGLSIKLLGSYEVALNGFIVLTLLIACIAPI